MQIMSIDPSITTIGIARLDGRRLVSSNTFRTDPKDTLIDRLREISVYFRAMKYKGDLVLIELPDSFMRMGDYSVRNARSIQLLMLAIGVITASLIDRNKIEFVGVREWKGQADKRVTQMIAEQECGKKLNNHEADAYVMALRWKTVLKFKKLVRE